MTAINNREFNILFLGDIVFFGFSLWLSLLLRNLSIPSIDIFLKHIVPFGVLLLLWLLVFYSAGLYEKHTLVYWKTLSSRLLNTQIINIVLAVFFFYFIPFFGIAPKTILFFHLIISSLLLLFWRLFLFPKLIPEKKQKAVIIGLTKEAGELKDEINKNARYSFYLAKTLDEDDQDLDKELREFLLQNKSVLIIADGDNKEISSLVLGLVVKGATFIDIHDLYETIFDRVAISAVKDRWIMNNIVFTKRFAYDLVKRVIDIIISFVLGIVSLIFYPFVIVAVFIEDQRSAFIVQDRVGKNGEIIKLLKFRSMRVNDGGQWPSEGDSRITKVGEFLRKTRIDELPQLWNVLKGDISLIGPRPDMTGLFGQLKESLPYYDLRTLVKPGLSGWAQTHQEVPPHSLEETELRLAYDFYYIKHRSFLLDIKIALQTIKTLISRTGK